MDGDEGEHCEAFLVVEVAEDARDGLFAFVVGEDLDERVGGAGAGLEMLVSWYDMRCGLVRTSVE